MTLRVALLIAMVWLSAGCNGVFIRARQQSSSTQPASYRAAPGSTRDPLAAMARKIFDKANRQRRLHAVGQLEWNDAVAGQARIASMRMMDGGFFSHVNPERGALAKRLNAAAIRWTLCGENIFREHGMEDPADAAIEGWMKSPAHRQSLLEPAFTQTGVGIAISPDTEYFITQIFICPPR